MIKIKAVYIGDATESFVERNFSDGINVIYSMDNNRGKTVLMQGIMYTLGALPTFPSSFPYRDYIYIADLNINNKNISILRYKNSFAVKTNGRFDLFESVAEFSKYWNKTICPLPNIVKEGHLIPVGLELYTQIAFVSQDSKSSAKIHAGRFNKKDFLEMLYAIKGLDRQELDSIHEQDLKRRRDELKGIIKIRRKEATVLNERGTAMSMVSAAVDNRDTKELIEELEKARIDVANLKKRRSRLLDSLENSRETLDELLSLRLDTPKGELVCFDCGSTHIGYRMPSSEPLFDVTTPNMRTQIIDSLKERIESINFDLENNERELRKAQRHLGELLSKNDDFSLTDLVACKDMFLDVKEIDREIQDAQQEINEIDNMLKIKKGLTNKLKERRREFYEDLISEMNHVRQMISGNNQSIPYTALFSTSTNVFSGSDETIYFASREYALSKVLDHGMPLLIDSFREEDLSTMRENRMLDLFAELPNQMILTTTVKHEEGKEKYESDKRVHAIDYSNHEVEKILNSSYNESFIAKVREFGIVLPQ